MKLKTPEIMKLFGSSKSKKNGNGENFLKLEIISNTSQK